jgi:hypothetical protein
MLFLEGCLRMLSKRLKLLHWPGAEFPATSGGAILNIITNKNAKNYLSDLL